MTGDLVNRAFARHRVSDREDRQVTTSLTDISRRYIWCTLPRVRRPPDDHDAREVQPVMSRRSDLLELAVLGLLHETPMHGYELRKRLNAALGAFRALSYGSLYPCLRELLDQGLDRRGAPATSTRRPRPAPSGPGSSTSSPPTARSTSRTCSPRPGRPPGRTRPSTSTSPSSPAPRPRSGCASSRAGAAGSRSGSTTIRTGVGQEPRAARHLHRRAAAARPGVRRARGPLAQRADRPTERQHPRLGDPAAPPQQHHPADDTTRHHTDNEGVIAWDPSASPSSASATAPARWSRASSTTRTPTRAAPCPA